MNQPPRENFPEGVRNGILIKNIDFDMTAEELKSFLEGIPIYK